MRGGERGAYEEEEGAEEEEEEDWAREIGVIHDVVVYSRERIEDCEGLEDVSYALLVPCSWIWPSCAQCLYKATGRLRALLLV